MAPRRVSSARRRVADDAQPGLPFDVAAPAGSRPGLESSTPCSRAFDSDDWLFGIDWEGSRCLLVAGDDGSVRLRGELAELGDRFPEVVAGAPGVLGRPAVLDGTVCVLDALGRPDIGALARRTAGRLAAPRAVFLASDLLAVDGRWQLSRPLHSRLAALADLVGGGTVVQAPEHVAGNGVALAEAATERGLAALVARRRDSSYHPGVASPDRLRIALTGRRDAVVVGVRGRAGGTQVLVADWHEGDLQVVAAVSVDDAAVRDWLSSAVEPAARPPALDPTAAAGGVSWVRPRLVATIEPAVTVTGVDVRSWRLVALRDDVDPRWCVRRTPVEPPAGAGAPATRPFSPTVLNPLPIDGAA